MDQQLTRNLTEENAIVFVDHLFRYVAKRRKIRDRRNPLPLVSSHESKTAPPGTYRQNDLPERIYVAFRALMQAGFNNKAACMTIAERLPVPTKPTKRGRPSRGGERQIEDRAKSVRSRVASYRRRSLRSMKESALERFVQARIDRFIYEQRAGLLDGPEYPKDSGARLMDWYRRERQQIYRIPRHWP